jgi:hypothetical protein
MFEITYRATSELEKVREARRVGDECGVRLQSDNVGRLRLTFDTPRSNDLVLRASEDQAVIVDRSVALLMDSAVLDFQPDVHGGCAVGESFMLRRRESRDNGIRAYID